MQDILIISFEVSVSFHKMSSKSVVGGTHWREAQTTMVGIEEVRLRVVLRESPVVCVRRAEERLQGRRANVKFLRQRLAREEQVAFAADERRENLW